MEGLSLISIVATCIDLAQTIDAAVQRVRGARDELDEGLQTVSSTRRLLSQFQHMFESSHLPQDVLEDYIKNMRPLQCELESIQRSLNRYLRSSSKRKGFASLAWRIKWGRDSDKHQRNLKNLNNNLYNTIATLTLKVNILAFDAIQVGHGRGSGSSSPAPDSPVMSTEEALSALGKEYARAAQDLQDMEWQNIPVAHIQQSYAAAAKTFQIEEWSGPQPGSFCSSAFTFTVNEPKMNVCLEKV
ncbi:uncharacterized protein LAJ45_04601 [Morchella importuna]|uniref:Fungal N-terminal domain-containing protein n=1 Tax=Morchella conica CCBAS932 TaxID=1392247 RepID=A0A3N4KPC2_9PEZI|nr:uncharacterized protein LAJ45_04601 [Morchella importuna]KAH8151398.1 hypothetical protein LAJ45_04601 [Morchella importuna]RPB07625.1 hypothetical protein P167DRAFT_579066 [Morchella conica CCBAS932]